MRKKEKEDSDQEGGVESAVVRKEKSSVKSALSATTAGQKRKMDSFYESSKTVMPSIGKDLSATAPAEEELDEPQGKGAAVRGESEGGLYKGEANRQKLIQKREVMDKKSNSIGPIKAPTNVRMTCRCGPYSCIL